MHACVFSNGSLTWEDVLIAVLVHVFLQLGSVAGDGGGTACLEGQELLTEPPVCIFVQILHVG